MLVCISIKNLLNSDSWLKSPKIRTSSFGPDWAPISASYTDSKRRRVQL